MNHYFSILFWSAVKKKEYTKNALCMFENNSS